MHFDADVNKEDIILEFDKAVDNYLSSLPKEKSTGLESFSIEWYTKIYTTTGTQTDNGTDGDVYNSIWYDTSAGTHRAYEVLDNEGHDRQGGIDAYFN